jgi:hypothetical protein
MSFFWQNIAYMMEKKEKILMALSGWGERWKEGCVNLQFRKLAFLIIAALTIITKLIDGSRAVCATLVAGKFSSF